MAQPSQTDTWVTAARRGDGLALAKLLATYHPRLRARAEAGMDAALKGRVAPEDVLQDVYVQVFRHIDRFEERGPGSFLDWVYTILDHQLVDAHRAAHRQVRDVAREVPAQGGSSTGSYWSLLDHVYADAATPSRVVRRQEALAALLACVSELHPSYREGLSVEQVAARLGKSEAAVVALGQRALKALRQSMDGLGEFTRGQ
jgi:RNA polymerase sigma-70 factor (subfamily 1)